VIRIRRALVSTYSKEGLDSLIAAIVATGGEVLSTGGTYRWILEQGYTAINLERWAGLPSMFGGRVKTLHPRVHGGILYRREDAKDEEERRQHGIEPIDMVVVNLYPFEETVRKDPSAMEAAIEMIDVGGPAMLRAAAKNHRSVAVVCDPADYARVAALLREGKGSLEPSFLRELAAKAFRMTGCYDAAVANYLARAIDSNDAALPEAFVAGAPLLFPLRYGENPAQRGAFYGTPAGFPGGLRKLQGKEISFNNLQDLEAAVILARDLGPEPAAAVIKHATPCGAAVGDTVRDAYVLARDCDTLSAFGGIVAVNRAVDTACAEEIAKTFLEVVVAPAFDEGARAVFGAKKTLSLLEGNLAPRPSASAPLYSFRGLGDGILLQDPLPAHHGEEEWVVTTKRAPTESERRALLFAWKVVRAVRSNGVVLTDERRTLGIGGGQTSRIDSLTIAVHKAAREGHSLAGSVMASDAFFPFPDCIEEAARIGVTAVIHPGGSKRDGDSVAAADAHGMAMVINNARAFRHG
jgi:phosphoribosylaminoimidazolecarboxamide formyltransferase / IMP cyclohydrolase